MTMPRKETVIPGQVGTYLCTSRCVRRAFLCGRDPLTGKDFEHRKGWILDFFRFLARFTAVDVGAYTVLSNHYHVFLRSRPDRVVSWDDREVATRWVTLYPGSSASPRRPRRSRSRSSSKTAAPERRNDDVESMKELAREARIQALCAHPEKMAQIREDLSNISRFMAFVNQRVARRANLEDDCTGRFWQGRFGSVAALDDGALLAGMVYVDLNEIRAGIAATPEASSFSTVGLRIQAHQARALLAALDVATEAATEAVTAPSTAPALQPVSMSSFEGEVADSKPLAASLPQQKIETSIEEVRNQTTADGWLAPLDRRVDAENGILPISATEYFDLVDWTGRQLKEGKRGTIPAHLAPILDRLGLAREAWLKMVGQYDSLFWRVAGWIESIVRAAIRAKRRWLKGMTHAKELYLSGGSSG